MIVISDIHGRTDLLEQFLNPNNEEKILVSLGDFGMVWMYEDSFLDWFEGCYPDKKILVAGGNHENYYLINSYPMTKIYGAAARKVRKNIFFIERGEIAVIEGKTCLFIGGADSYDKEWRLSQPIISWWEEETITTYQFNNAVKNLNSVNGKVDFIFSHTAPRFICEKLVNVYSPNPSEVFLEKMCEFVHKCHIWFCGHWHMSKTFDYPFGQIRVMDIGETEEI